MKKRYFFFWVITIFFQFSCIKAQNVDTTWVLCFNKQCKIYDPFYFKGENISWEGNTDSGFAEGYGVSKLYYDSTHISTFSGNYHKGKRNGTGKLSFITTNQTWEGQFTEGQLTGKGKYTDDEGNTYEGDFINYKQHGIGIKKFGNGSKFEGLFNNSLQWTGTLNNYDGSLIYYYRGEPIKTNKLIQSDYNPKLGEQLTEYFDKDWNRCIPKEAAYYRLVTYSSPNIPKGKIRDYSISGRLLSEYYAKFIDYTDDQLIFYIENQKIYFNSGSVYKIISYGNSNTKSGPQVTYYENGDVESVVYYENGKREGYYKYWGKNGKLQYYAEYEDDALVNGKYIEYDDAGLTSLVHHESFVDKLNQWKYKDDGSESIVNADNQLEVTTLTSGPSYRTEIMEISNDFPFSIEGSFSRKMGKGNCAFGLIFGKKDANNCSYFVITEDGYYSVLNIIEGIINKISDWKKSSFILKDDQVNTLKIAGIEKKLYFFINGEKVESIDAIPFRGSRYGIYAKGKGTYVFHNFTTKELIPADKVHRKDLPVESDGELSQWKGNGTGFFINESGYIATNYHVVEDATEIQVVYHQKEKKISYKSKVLIFDKENDLAILKIDDSTFHSIPEIPYVFTISQKDVGTEVFALGYPIANVMGADIKFTDGKISAQSGILGDIRYYQTSTPIQPGNSGGPLFDIRGNLIGITSARLNKEKFESENVNYAIKTNVLKKLISKLSPQISLPENTEIYSRSLTDKIKILSDFIPMILVK